MIDVLASALGAAGALLAAVFGSQLFTREGRLTSRVQRLGAAHAVLPDSEARHNLERQLLLAAAELNDWIDPGQVARRWIVRVFTFVLFVAAVIGLGFLANDYDLDFGTTTVLGFVMGALIGIVSLVAAGILQHVVQTRRAVAQSSERLQQFKKGEPPRSAPL